MSFEKFDLLPAITKTITDLGYKNPTAIQELVIPRIIEGRDLIGIAPTGTGKTAAFTLPMLQCLVKDLVSAAGEIPSQSKPRSPRALVLTPTRELALQVFEDVSRYGRDLDLVPIHLHGGVSYDTQTEKLTAGVDIVIATPGRLRDLLERRALDFLNLSFLVLDEADRMLDMGFIEDVEVIIDSTPKARQTVLFSATMSDEIKKLAQKFLRNPLMVHATPKTLTAPKVRHVIHPVDLEKKTALLIHLIQNAPQNQILVFTRTKVRADEVAAALTSHNIFCMATHSDRTQAYRTKAMACFKDGRIRVLVATDIAARGLDIDDLNLVINYEIPNLPEDYVHRIGRTGRADAEGQALSLVTQSELRLLSPIEALIKATIPQIWVEGFAPQNFDPRFQNQKKSAVKGRQPKSRQPKSRRAKGRRWE